jgi:hypothetical protein
LYGLLLLLLLGASGMTGIIVLVIFIAVLCYTALELFVQSKKYYNGGVDNVLMLSVISFLMSTFFISDVKISATVISFVMKQ